MSNQHVFSKYGGTRFVTTIGCGFVSALLLKFGDLTGDQFVEITKWTVSVFIGSHAGQNIAGFFTHRSASQSGGSEEQSHGNKQY